MRSDLNLFLFSTNQGFGFIVLLLGIIWEIPQRTKRKRHQNIKSNPRRKQMAASYRTQSAKRWLPLEANPDVMNQILK
ncbi:uncharacterized protein LOC133707345 isoform X2 [Rosa rugosa]|uniref:uncharacterized protein LOC133707345 isoform X2 n=1 Tax=Rosa rugosa TaxID=74645 RepID=UPI002B41792F|nr:uncharacterized protein LOC133707345 isoform X2 [Rosa rugosa]